MSQLLTTNSPVGPVTFGLLTVGLAVAGLAFAWIVRHRMTAVVAGLVLIVGAGATGMYVSGSDGTAREFDLGRDGHPRGTPSTSAGPAGNAAGQPTTTAAPAMDRSTSESFGDKAIPEAPVRTTPTRQRAFALSIDPTPEAGRCARFTGVGQAPAGQTLWLTVESDQPRYYFYTVVVRAGTYQWYAANVELGTEREQAGEPYNVGIALADEQTTRALRAGDYRNGVPNLPPGMRIVDEIFVVRSADARRCQSQEPALAARAE